MPNNNPQQTSSQQRSTEGSSKLTDRIEKTAEQTTSAALQRVRDARDQATSGIEHQRAEIADRIRRLGGVLRAGSETLSMDDPYAQNLLSVAGDRVQQTADYIESLTPSQIVDDVQQFARRRPGVFFGTAFVLGLGLGRFAKSSKRAATDSDMDYENESYDDDDVEPAMLSQATATQQVAAPQGGARGASPVSPSSGTAYGTGGTGGASGSSLPYGVGSSTSSTGATTGTSAATSPSTTQSGLGVGGTGSYGVGSTAPQGTAGTSTVKTQSGASSAASTSPTSSPSSSTPGSSTPSGTSGAPGTPRETERGQGSKS